MLFVFQEYFIFVAQLEHQFQQVQFSSSLLVRDLHVSPSIMDSNLCNFLSSCLKFKRVLFFLQGQLSLQKFWFHIQPCLRRMEVLSSIAEAIETVRRKTSCQLKVDVSTGLFIKTRVPSNHATD
jgi:hypothetical protein